MSTLPAPLTTVECDLRRMPGMLLEVSRLRDSDFAQAKDAEVFRCGVLSWAASWHQVPAGSLPDDDRKLARLIGYGRNVRGFRRIKEKGGMHGWVLCSDGRLYHPEVCEKANHAMRLQNAQKSRTSAASIAKSEIRLERIFMDNLHGLPHVPSTERGYVSGWIELRESIFCRDSFTCQYCGDTPRDLHCDHIHPVSRGGTNDPGNLVTACGSCNMNKGDRLLSEWVRS